LPRGLGAAIERGTWREPEIFGWVQRASGASDADMFSTFNMGIGMIVVAGAGDTDAVLAAAPGATVVGRVTVGAGVRLT
jgi:phosphoribosylformylglycinamidine cyclo-ligase